MKNSDRPSFPREFLFSSLSLVREAIEAIVSEETFHPRVGVRNFETRNNDREAIDLTNGGGRRMIIISSFLARFHIPIKGNSGSPFRRNRDTDEINIGSTIDFLVNCNLLPPDHRFRQRTTFDNVSSFQNSPRSLFIM